MTTPRLPPNSIPIDNDLPSEDLPNPIVENIPRQSHLVDPDDSIIDEAEDVEDLPLEATQPRSQSYDPQTAFDYQKHLVGSLISKRGEEVLHFELEKSKNLWRIGRHPSNDLVLSGDEIGEFHCEITWNKGVGEKSEVTLVNKSRNATWVNSFICLDKDKSSSILRSGFEISFGVQPRVKDGWHSIFVDIERQSADRMLPTWKKYQRGHKLGNGEFGQVYYCIERATGKEYAMKIIDRKKELPSSKWIQREVSILQRLSRLRHENIVSLHEFFKKDDSVSLILEFVAGGTLFEHIDRRGALSEIEVRRMAGQICSAVAHIHSHGVTHRDLKPENVLLTSGSKPNCKIADFGLAKLADGGSFLRTICGTENYLAPEVILRGNIHLEPYDNKVDSWSLGVIFYHMLTKRMPCRPRATSEEKRRYFRDRTIDWNTLDSLPLSQDGRAFLRCLLVEDPGKRQTVSKMLHHPWIKSFITSTDLELQDPLPADTEFRLTPSPIASRQTMPTAHARTGQAQSHLDPENDDERVKLSDIPIQGLNLLTRMEIDASGRMPGTSRQGSAGAANGQAGKRKIAESDEDEEESEPAPKKPKLKETKAAKKTRRAAPRRKPSTDEERPTRRSLRNMSSKVSRYA